MRAKASKETMFILSLASILIIITFEIAAVLASSGNIMVAVYGSTPTIDGSIRDDEWDDASIINISVTDDANCTVYTKQDGINLYVGFSVPDVSYNSSDCCGILFDVNHDEHTSLQTDDIWLAISRKGSRSEKNVTLGGWYQISVSGWTANASSTASGWQSEYNITYSKLGVTAGTNKTLGVMFLLVDKDVEMGWYTWPSPWISKPATWGDMAPNEYYWIPEFSTWTSLLLLLIVLTVIPAIYKHRLLKTALH